jgi:hypothetical protein
VNAILARAAAYANADACAYAVATANAPAYAPSGGRKKVAS